MVGRCAIAVPLKFVNSGVLYLDIVLKYKLKKNMITQGQAVLLS
jgi:hypothetical protein